MRHATPLLLLVTACGLSAEEQFVGKNRLDSCDGAVPVCSTTAGCRLGEDENYVEVKMPGYRAYVVHTEGEADLTLRFYWKTQLAPGKDVEFSFFEPGCNEPHRVTESGETMFRQIGNDSQWELTQTVYRGGDHLVEMRMDAQGEFIMKVVVTTPEERGQAQETDDAPEPELPEF